MDGILLRPLPFDEPGKLVTVWADLSERGGPTQEWLSFPNYEDARESGVFKELGAYLEWQATLTGNGPAQTIQGLQVTRGTLSEVLRVEPVLGRGFLLEDEGNGAPRVVLIGYGLWQRLYGGDPAVVGRTMILNGESHEIIGVMGPGFVAPVLGGAFSADNSQQDLWRPLQVAGTPQLGSRGSALFRTLGRLGEQVSFEIGRERILELGTRLQEAYPADNTGVTYSLIPLKENMVQAQKTGLWVLLGAVGFILLLVCLNLANLLLARGTTRTGEIALRSALGAGRGRLVGQLMTESLILAVLGGGMGILLAYAGTDLLLALAPAGTPRLASVTVDGRILSFAIAATLGSGTLFGLLPALRSSAVDLRSDLAHGTRTTQSGGGFRVRAAMVVVQMGAALVLLVGAGLLLRTFRELTRVDLGYDSRGVVAALVTLNEDQYPEAGERNAFVNELETRLVSLPGVESVGVVSTLPLSGANADVDFQVEGRADPPPGQENISWIRRISPGYLSTMKIPILEGRSFSAADGWDDAARVVMVNETLANRFFPGESAVGKRLNFNDPENPRWREIVGVVKNVKNFGIRGECPVATYFPYAQAPGQVLFITARTSMEDPQALVPAMRRELGEMDDQLALAQPTTMESLVSGALGQERFVAMLLSLFAGVALLLAAVGLYGVVTYDVSQRTRELGLRIALGADSARIHRLVLRRSFLLAGLGMVGGLAGALVLTRLFEGILFGVSSTDPITLTVMTLSLLGATGLASLVPALRAARVDPSRALNVD